MLLFANNNDWSHKFTLQSKARKTKNSSKKIKEQTHTNKKFRQKIPPKYNLMTAVSSVFVGLWRDFINIYGKTGFHGNHNIDTDRLERKKNIRSTIKCDIISSFQLLLSIQHVSFTT